VLIGAAVAFDTVLEIANPFLNVLSPDLLGRVLMATVTGIATVVVTLMAGYAFHIVISVQNEILVVIEGRGYPFLLAMALAAIACDLLMDRIIG
jgi:hypothetical protein